MKEKNKGITLIALVITIIVMLILVAVTISIAINGGLFEKAGEAVGDTKNEINKEQELADGRIQVGDKIYNSINEYLEAIKPLPEINAGERAETNSTYTKNGKTAIIPAGFTVSGITNEQTIEDGLVIYDIPEDIDTTVEGFWTNEVLDTELSEGGDKFPAVQKEYNQFVWIPVEKAYVTQEEITKVIADNENITTEVQAVQKLADEGTYPMAVQMLNENYRGILYEPLLDNTSGKVKLKVMKFNSSLTDSYEYVETPADGITYEMKYSFREPGTTENDGDSRYSSYNITQTNLQNEYNDIVKSVAEKHGFYVARYELSYDKVEEKGTSRRGQIVASAADDNTKMWYGLYETCEGMYKSNELKVQSNMIYGSQWDQIMIYMKEVANPDYDKEKNKGPFYILDSTGMGNYGAKQVSGYKNTYEVKKIYDLGGNLDDWTSEAYSTFGRVPRGGSGYDYAYGSPASGRNTYSIEPNVAHRNRSARSALYIK